MIRANCLSGRRAWLVASAAALLAVVPRAFYLTLPFERDEGAYAYMAEVIGRGGLPYVHAFDHKPPLVYYFYQLSLQLFGHTVAAPRLLAMLFVAVACLLVLLLVYRFTRSLAAGVFSCLLLGMASTLPAYTGFSANTEVFTLPFLAGGVLLLAEETPAPQRFFWAGLLFGAGIMVKQPVAAIALAVLAFHAVAMARTPWRLVGRMALAGCGLLLPLVLFSAYFAAAGEFTTFWESFYIYNVSYAQDTDFVTSVAHLSMFLGSILRNDTLTWLAAVVGLLVWFRSSRNLPDKAFIGLLLAGSVAATSMGGNFYHHYFIFLLPALVTAAGLGAAILLEGSRADLVRWGLVVLVGVPFALNVRFLFMPAKELLSMSFGSPPFSQAKAVGEFLKGRVAPESTAYIIGSEPEIYFYSGLRAPSRYYYLYPLVGQTPQNEATRQQVLADLQRNMPAFMIFVNAPLSLGARTLADKKCLQDLYRTFSSYRLTAMSQSDSETVLTGDGPLTRGLAETEGEGAIIVFARNSGAAQPAQKTFGSLMGLQEH